MTSAVVVLGCTLKQGEPTPALTRRVALAVRAYQSGTVDRVIASGGRRWDGHVEALVIARTLRQFGIPSSDITCELCSLSTLENAFFCAQLLRDVHESASGPAPATADRVMLATCHWHLPRALRHFRRFGVDAIAPPEHWHQELDASVSRRLYEGVRTLFDNAVAARGELS